MFDFAVAFIYTGFLGVIAVSVGAVVKSYLDAVHNKDNCQTC